MISYIQLIDKIKEFCNCHEQVKRFGADFTEQMSNFATSSTEFPIVFVAPVNKTVTTDVSTFTVDIYSWDIIVEDRSNINTCLSDTDLILTDIHNYFKNGDDYTIDITNQPLISPLNNGLLDYTVGNVMRIDFEISNYCVQAIPKNC
jgi:hypothetical protein